VSTRKLLVVALVGAALVLVLGGLGVARSVSHRPVATPRVSRSAVATGAVLTAEQVYQRYGQGVVQVIAVAPAATGATRAVDNGSGPRGLGFAVSGTLILTSARLVDRHGSIAKTATVIFKSGAGQEQRTVGTIVCVDAALDLAVIRVDAAQAAGLVVLPMGDSSALRAGQSLTALGDPLAASPTAAALVVTAPRRLLRATSGVALQAIVLSGPSLAGRSGAPLFDASGRVLAVVDSVGAPTGAPRSAGTAVPINDAAHVIADALAN
jgi:S1-C subfamily serine protease